jgi:hypothetical protein
MLFDFRVQLKGFFKYILKNPGKDSIQSILHELPTHGAAFMAGLLIIFHSVILWKYAPIL